MTAPHVERAAKAHFMRVTAGDPEGPMSADAWENMPDFIRDPFRRMVEQILADAEPELLAVVAAARQMYLDAAGGHLPYSTYTRLGESLDVLDAKDGAS